MLQPSKRSISSPGGIAVGVVAAVDPTTPSCRRLTAGCARTTTSEVISAVRKFGNVSREVGGWMPRSRSRMTPPPMPDLWGHGIVSQLLKQAVDSFRTAPTSTTVLAFRAAVSFAAGWACSDLPADRGDRGCGVRWCARAKLRPQTVRFHYSIRRRSLRTGINPGRAVVGSCFTSEHLRGGCLPPMVSESEPTDHHARPSLFEQQQSQRHGGKSCLQNQLLTAFAEV